MVFYTRLKKHDFNDTTLYSEHMIDYICIQVARLNTCPADVVMSIPLVYKHYHCYPLRGR